MPFKKLTQPRSKCLKATARVTQVFPSLCWRFVLKRKRSLSGRFLPSTGITKTLAGRWGCELQRPTFLPFGLFASLLPSFWQHLAKSGPNPAYPLALCGDPRVRSLRGTLCSSSEAASSQTQSEFNNQKSPAFARCSPPSVGAKIKSAVPGVGPAETLKQAPVDLQT